jgi:phospholipid-binding lipoprotein MlaA
MPKRFVNCLLQGKLQGAGTELARFSINTTFGLGGLFNPAGKCLEDFNEDSGQTLGNYGIGTGMYIVWPLLGPSSLRGTAGTVLDTALNPLTYVKMKFWEKLSIRGYYSVNDTSLRLGEYEDLKQSAIDPYIALRNAYFQHRQDALNN